MLQLPGTSSVESSKDVAERVPTCRRSRRLQGLLDHESGGTSGYNAHASDPVEVCGLHTHTLTAAGPQPTSDICIACNVSMLQAGALTAPLWELSLLTQHYHPRIMANALQQLGRKA
jgi:hypothetical protein